MSTFADAVNAKIQEKGLNATAAAEAIGVSAVSLRAVISGKSVPNARSLGKYISFAGLSAEEAKALIAAGRSAGPTKAKKGPKAKKGQKKAKKGEKKAAKTPKAAKAGKPGRKPRSAGSSNAALAQIGQALAAAESLAGDKLAMTVHGLSAGQRKIVAAIIANL